MSLSSDTPLVAHLVELRNRLIYCLVTVGLVFIGLVYFANDLYAVLAGPMLKLLPHGSSMIAIGVISPLFTPIKLTVFLSLFIAMPIVLYHIWAFIAPGLYRTEKRFVWPILVTSVLLFYAGILFVYYLVFPLIFSFLIHVAPAGISVMPDIHEFLSFALRLFLAFGIVFEVPVLILILVRVGITSRSALSKKRPYVVVGAFVLGMILTPPDVISQVMLAIPICLLFEIGLFLSRWVEPKLK